MASVIDALKRLERAGDEHSRTTEKLVAAARTLAEHIAGQCGFDHGDFRGVLLEELPRNYVIYHDATGIGPASWDYDADRWLGVWANRQTALEFAGAIATGWLDELAEWLDQRAAEDQAACDALGCALSNSVAQG